MSLFMELSPEQLGAKLKFINNYIQPTNAADVSLVDANANIAQKNVATLAQEIHKDINVQLNRALMTNKISELFGTELAQEYIRQLENHEIYKHDETHPFFPYCASITMYPFLLNGLTTLGGESLAPKHLDSFCGSFVNLVFAISSQFAGACGTPEFLLYFDYFARLDYGDNYLLTHKSEVENHLQHVVYALNQPAAARGYQSIFWNISIFDNNFLSSLFADFVFPDGTRPDFASVMNLEEFFLSWFNQERTKAILTFPVVTVAMLTQNNQPKDDEFAKMCAVQMHEGNSFFIYMSESVDSLSSCCRLRNELTDNTFSNTSGAGGVATGSINVITLNMNRLVLEKRDLLTEINKIHKYHVAYRKIVEDFLNANLLPVYSAGYININKQFLTIGINGMLEAAESMGITPGNNLEYIQFLQQQLKIIYDANRAARQEYGYLFNTEFVPAENLGVKNAKWDKQAGYQINRDCYNSYFYPVEDDGINVVDKFILHGREITQYLDGGSALHLNTDGYLTVEGYLKLFNLAAKTGCNYWTTNVKVTYCCDCSTVNKLTLDYCPQCSSKNVRHATRVIGYLKLIDNFSKERRIEEKMRHYHPMPFK